MTGNLLVEPWYQHVERRLIDEKKAGDRLCLEIVGEAGDEHRRAGWRLSQALRKKLKARIDIRWRVTAADDYDRSCEKAAGTLIEALDTPTLGWRLRWATAQLRDYVFAGRPVREWHLKLSRLVSRASRELGVVAYVELAAGPDDGKPAFGPSRAVARHFLAQGATVVASGTRAWLDPPAGSDHQVIRLPDITQTDYSRWILKRWQEISDQPLGGRGWPDLVVAAAFPNVIPGDQLLSNLADSPLSAAEKETFTRDLFLFVLRLTFPGLFRELRLRPAALIRTIDVLMVEEPPGENCDRIISLIGGDEGAERFRRLIHAAFAGKPLFREVTDCEIVDPAARSLADLVDLALRSEAEKDESGGAATARSGGQWPRFVTGLRALWELRKIGRLEKAFARTDRGDEIEAALADYRRFRARVEPTLLRHRRFAREMIAVCGQALRLMGPREALRELSDIEANPDLKGPWLTAAKLSYYSEVLLKPDQPGVLEFKQALLDFLSLAHEAELEQPHDGEYLKALGEHALKAENLLAISGVAKRWTEKLDRGHKVEPARARGFVSRALELVRTRPIRAFLSWSHKDPGAALTMQRAGGWEPDVEVVTDQHAAPQYDAPGRLWRERVYGGLKDSALIVIPNLSSDYLKGAGVKEELEIAEMLHQLHWARVFYRMDGMNREDDAEPVPQWILDTEAVEWARSSSVPEEKERFQDKLIENARALRAEITENLRTLEALVQAPIVQRTESPGVSATVDEPGAVASDSPEAHASPPAEAEGPNGVEIFQDREHFSDYAGFQKWRRENPKGITLNRKSRFKAVIHLADCKHFGPVDAPPNGRGSLTAHMKVCASSLQHVEIWADERKIERERCSTCAPR